MVVLVPNDPEARMMHIRRDQSDSDGSFALLNVVPGDYTIVAIDGGWDVDWAKPGMIEKYLAAGVKITVPERAGEVTRPNAPVPIQTR